MATEAQVEANRQNAQKSTGPRTAEGKAAASQNALKHGLFAVQDVLSTENQAEFDLMREEMLAELAPVGVIESLLAQRAVRLAWRLKRAEHMQNEAIEQIIEHGITGLEDKAEGVPEDYPSVQEDHLTLGRAAVHDWSNEKLLERMFNYERRIENSLYKTMGQLRAVQKQRMAAAEAKRRAQAQEEDSAKQSQSGRNPSSYEGLPYGLDLDSEVLSDLEQMSCSQQLAFLAAAMPKHSDKFPAHGPALADASQSIGTSQTPGSVRRPPSPVTLLSA